LIARNVRVIDSLDCYHFLLVEGVQHHLSLVAKTQYTMRPWCHGEAGVRLHSPSSPAPQPPPLSSTNDRRRPLTGTPFDRPSASSYQTYWMQSPAFHRMQVTCYIFCNLHAKCLRSSRRNAPIHCSA